MAGGQWWLQWELVGKEITYPSTQTVWACPVQFDQQSYSAPFLVTTFHFFFYRNSWANQRFMCHHWHLTLSHPQICYQGNWLWQKWRPCSLSVLKCRDTVQSRTWMENRGTSWQFSLAESQPMCLTWSHEWGNTFKVVFNSDQGLDWKSNYSSLYRGCGFGKSM